MTPRANQEIEMKPVFYTHIRPAIGQTVVDVIRRAHTLGYEMMTFAGWTDADLGPSGMPGPRRAEAKANGELIRAIQDACELDGDWPHIEQCAEPYEHRQTE
jgi:hypothetical protein